MPPGRVLIALDDSAMEPTPTWTRIDDVPGLVASIEISRGRQTEFDITDTGTATVHLNDRTGDFDADNTASPYWGRLDGKQIMLQLHNPVSGNWLPRFRGVIENYGYDLSPTQQVSKVQIDCVDAFAYLAEVEMIPGLFGQAPASINKSEGTVAYIGDTVQNRIANLLQDARWPAEMARIFTGNVDVMETNYDPGDSILVALRDAADAELPGIAQVFVDVNGIVCFHGRRARFDPDGTALGTDWDFTRWHAGDGAAIGDDPDQAHIRPPLQWARPRSRIINAAMCYPRDTSEGAEKKLPGQIVVDETSRNLYGYRSWSAPDLITFEGTTTGLDNYGETRLFASHYVANYKDMHTRCEAVTVKSISLEHPAAEQTWALLAGHDISDMVVLTVDYPGVTAVARDYYIEGSQMSITPLNPEMDMVEATLNISPAAYYNTDVFLP